MVRAGCNDILLYGPAYLMGRFAVASVRHVILSPHAPQKLLQSGENFIVKGQSSRSSDKAHHSQCKSILQAYLELSNIGLLLHGQLHCVL